MFSKVELISGAVAVACMSLALYLVQTDNDLSILSDNTSQLAAVSQAAAN